MTSSTSRRSFYPLPPSVYPMPLVDPCAAMETTYGHNHCAHSVRDGEFFRSRTLNPDSVPDCGPDCRPAAIACASKQGIYPRHGVGNYVLPLYRRDSKGFRRPFTQPAHVDEQHVATRDISGLARSGFNWLHPSSRPTYAASKTATVGGGATFGTSYRNSGLYDADSTHTNRVVKEVGRCLHTARNQQLCSDNCEANTSYLPATLPRAYSAPSSQQLSSSSFPSSSLGRYTGEVSSVPPCGADLYPDGYVSNLDSQLQTQRAIVGDPLLADARDNAYRKARTVYKRAYGLCQ